MLNHIKYVNHLNETIEFGKNILIVTDSDLLDFSWNVEKSNDIISGFTRKIASKSVTVVIKNRNEAEGVQTKNRFFEIFEKDVLAKKSGKFVIGDYYLKCYVIGSVKNDYVARSNYMTIKLKISTDYPYWCSETTKTFLKRNIKDIGEETDFYLYYPFSYPYQYSAPQDERFIQNDHYAACDFKMVIFGPCTNPAIMINGHLHEVKASIHDGERLEIDSRNHTVHRHMNDGRIENLFNLRNKESNLFEKIPNGRCNVLWNIEAFGFDLTLYKERSEPKWIL